MQCFFAFFEKVFSTLSKPPKKHVPHELVALQKTSRFFEGANINPFSLLQSYFLYFLKVFSKHPKKNKKQPVKELHPNVCPVFSECKDTTLFLYQTNFLQSIF